ncbi:MAG: tetratricopeptide repeat protein [Halieaceae bacterium]|nr:tetratricopeptide repeat protein [Halieaceae bacterium]
MDSYRTEEEQVEALRNWWRDNGKSTIAIVVLALGAGFGWQGWQQYRGEQAQSAAALYQDLLEAVNVSVSLSSAQAATARHLAGTLKSDYSGSIYAQFAAMQLARLAVNEDDLAAAEQELRWVLTRNPVGDIQRVARLRLARVIAARGETQQALDMLAVEAGAYAAVYAEARGDIHRLLAQEEQALAAYREAAGYNQDNGVANTGTLDLKLQSLQLQKPRAVSVSNQGENSDATN